MNAIQYIQHWEGFVPKLYLCPSGYPSLGYGTRVSSWSIHDFAMAAGEQAAKTLRAMIEADNGDWITEEQATALLVPAVDAALAKVGKLLEGGPPVTRGRYIALTDWFYNTGGGSMPGFKAAVVARDWELANEHLWWKIVDEFGKGVVAKGHTAYMEQTGRRAECNAQVVLTGEMPEVLP